MHASVYRTGFTFYFHIVKYIFLPLKQDVFLYHDEPAKINMYYLPFLGKLCIPKLCITDSLLLNADRDFQTHSKGSVTLE